MAADLFWTSVWLPILAGLALSFSIERLMRPGVSLVRQRPPAALALHCGLWLLVFAFELALFRRPWFAAFVVLTILAILVLVNNAKFDALREPFIVQDFEYFIDTLRHPRLYLPFFGLGKALLATVAFLLALFTGMRLEAPLTDTIAPRDVITGWTLLVLTGLLLLLGGAKRKLPVCFEPERDLKSLGLLACLWRYGEEERHCPQVASPLASRQRRQKSTSPLPHLVVVQSESFVDVRACFAGISPDILAHFDALKRGASLQGKVEVPAWGANTVRTEFAFLSGLSAEQLGVHRFNPYRKLARSGGMTLVSLLKNLGYRTVCVHPYPAGFYGRDKVFPQLGFDAFIDIRDFQGSPKCGPYVGDLALAEKVCTLLKPDALGPLFVFVITMENHGPLHWEKVATGDVERLYTTPPPAGCEDLTIYLRHLANADCMAGMLGKHLAAIPQPGWLCWFGDHVPIMPGVYDSLGVPDGKTDYLIWSKDGSASAENRLDLRVEELGGLLLEKMGLISAATEAVSTRSPAPS
jgi:hypothetical protein